jgi:hypothetical protein
VSNFAFLQAEWPLLHESATKAEDMVHADARAALAARVTDADV